MGEFSDWHPENKNTHVFLFFISLGFTFGNRCCHVTKINGRSGNEPKPFNPVFLYNANVFLPNIPKYANVTCSTNFQGAILTKNVIKLFSRKASMHTNCSISRLPLLSQLPRTPSSVLSCPQRLHAPGRVPQRCPVQGKGTSQVTTLRCVAAARRSVQVRTAV